MPSEVSNGFAVIGDPRAFPADAWERYEETIVKPNLDPARPVGAYAASVRRRRRSGCPVHAAARMNGYLAAAVAVLIWASYPVATRAGVTGSFAPQELVTLRFGVGALLFLPYLLLHWRHIRRAAWLQGVPLTLFQGAGMGALVICGLQLAPANHAAALGPGVNPAWVALLGFLRLRQTAVGARDRRGGAVRDRRVGARVLERLGDERRRARRGRDVPRARQRSVRSTCCSCATGESARSRAQRSFRSIRR